MLPVRVSISAVILESNLAIGNKEENEPRFGPSSSVSRNSALGCSHFIVASQTGPPTQRGRRN